MKIDNFDYGTPKACEDCEVGFKIGDTAVCFQDEQHHDVKQGWYCRACAGCYDENGNEITDLPF